MDFTEIQAKEPLHKLKNKFLPYQYDLNIYRGCSLGCVYCYARKSHEYLDDGTKRECSFEKNIFIKMVIEYQSYWVEQFGKMTQENMLFILLI